VAIVRESAASGARQWPAVRASERGQPEAMEITSFFTVVKSLFLPSLPGRTSFLREEIVSSLSSLFPHLMICHVNIFA
jgi:hypothetical protein